MSHTIIKLPNTTVELTITVPPPEYEKHLNKAAERLSEKIAIKGFRKGHVPYDVVKKEAGAMAIMEEALDPIVKETFYAAVIEEKLETIGMPEINVEKMAPGNDIVYKATVALMPRITLPDWKKIRVTHQTPTVPAAKVDETIDAIRGMHATEAIKQEAAEGTDKLVIDMDMLLDRVPIEGGQAKDYQVYLGEAHYIPGFNEQVAGLKKGDAKNFSLDFPKTHYQKQLADKTVDFAVRVKDVYRRELPAMDDEFAKKLGQESAAKLRELIHNNLLEEAAKKAEQNLEIELLEQAIAETTFDPIPDVIVNAERQRIFHELKRDLEKNGVAIEQYLADIKKDEKELFEDFKQQAEKRAKAALISRQIALDNDLKVSDKELEHEIELLKKTYARHKETADNLARPEVRDTIATQLQNKKVMRFLKAKALGEEMMKHGVVKGCEDCERDHAHEHVV